MRCKKRSEDKSCAGAGKPKAEHVEAFVYCEMRKRLREFHTLEERGKSAVNPKITAPRIELAKVETEIEKLIESLTGASEILISYANTKIADLDGRKQSLIKQLADIAADEVSPERMLRIARFLSDWENTAIEDKRQVTDAMIAKIHATHENVSIDWKI